MSADLDFGVNKDEIKKPKKNKLLILVVLIQFLAIAGLSAMSFLDKSIDKSLSPVESESVAVIQKNKVFIGPIIANTNLDSDYQYAQLSLVLITSSSDLESIVAENEFKFTSLVASQLRLATDEMLLTQPGLDVLGVRINEVVVAFLADQGFDVALIEEIIIVNAIVE